MCGIAGVYLRDESAKADLDAILDTMLDEIEHRGGDATGFVALGNEGVTEWQKAACEPRTSSATAARSRKGLGRCSLTRGGQPKGCLPSWRTTIP